jgi:predicted HTH domain antitoxin
MQLDIPDDVVQASGLSKEEFLQVLAVTLYDRERLSLGYASQLAHLSKSEFMNLLAAEGVEIKYDAEDLKKDLKNLKDL